MANNILFSIRCNSYLNTCILLLYFIFKMAIGKYTGCVKSLKMILLLKVKYVLLVTVKIVN